MTLEKYPGESAIFDIDCTDLLATAETITGTPAMSFLPALTAGDALTFGTPMVNNAPVVYPDRTAAIGKVIQVRISGGSSEATQRQRYYSVAATFTTTAGNTLVAKAMLAVLTMNPVKA